MELQRNLLSRRSRRPSTPVWPIMIILLLLSLSFLYSIYFLWTVVKPNTQFSSNAFQSIQKPIFYQGKLLDTTAIGQNESLELPFSVIKSFIDPNIRYESESNSIIMTTENRVVRLKTDQLTGMMNEQPFQLKFPTKKENDTIYVPIQPLLQLYHIKVTEVKQTGAVILQREGDIIQWGRTVSYAAKQTEIRMREESTIKAPIVQELSVDSPLMIWGEKHGWYLVQNDQGYVGYVMKGQAQLDHIETVPTVSPSHVFVSWKPLGGKINLTWEQVYQSNPNPQKIEAMPGVNVISPTWFKLKTGAGDLDNLADPSYVKWAHERGYQVWALFSNSFDKDLTHQALAGYDTRMKMIKQVLAYAQLYQLQGINIDFENVYLQDKDNFTQFIRELTPLLHEQGLVVSIDVTVKSSSETWSKFLDREALGRAVDYMMVMTYDEHWASSPEAGSVASLPWVEKGITQIMSDDHVPAKKILLGIPFYTRLWTETNANGKTSITSKSISMKKQQEFLQEKKLTPVFLPDLGQNYVKLSTADQTQEIWLEDAASIQSRIQLVKKYDLAGVASWCRGYETPEAWNVISKVLEQKP